MKKILFIVAAVLLMSPFVTAAQTKITVGCNTPSVSGTPCPLGYTPLEPLPGEDTSRLTNPAYLPQLINVAFRVLFTVGALMAVVMLVWGGIEYMVSDVIENKKEGLRRTRAALYGMLLLAGAWLILYTINPNLLNFTLNPCPQGSSGCTVNSTPVNNASGANLQNTQASAAQMQQYDLENNSILLYSPGAATQFSQQLNAFAQNCHQSGGIANPIIWDATQTAEVCQKPDASGYDIQGS